MVFGVAGERRSCSFHLHVHLAVHTSIAPVSGLEFRLGSKKKRHLMSQYSLIAYRGLQFLLLAQTPTRPHRPRAAIGFALPGGSRRESAAAHVPGSDTARQGTRVRRRHPQPAARRGGQSGTAVLADLHRSVPEREGPRQADTRCVPGRASDRARVRTCLRRSGLSPVPGAPVAAPAGLTCQSQPSRHHTNAPRARCGATPSPGPPAAAPSFA